MRIQHNISALNSYRNYTNNTNAVAKNLEKLSSGYRINRAGDDAAGLAISEKMRAQITGLETAQKNAQDGISLVQTAEGALTEVHSMLNRMVELADQSANGTYDNAVDRANLQKEVEQLNKEIDRIADATNFNGINLLDGTMAETTVGAVDPMAPTVGTQTDGTTAAAATEATIELTFDATGNATDTVFGQTLDTAAGTVQDLMDLNVGGQNLSEIFDFTGLTAGTALKGTTISLKAKNAGALDPAIVTELNKAPTGTVTGSFVNGTNEGAGAAATASKYEFEFDFTKLAGGMTFELGGEKFEISTSGTAVDPNANLIDLSGFDLGVAGANNAEGQWGAAAEIQAQLGAVFGADFNVDTAPAAAPAGNKFTISMTAKNTGEDGNLGEIRSSNAAIKGTYTAGTNQGLGQAGSFAQVTYEGFDLSKLAVGDKITIGSVDMEIVEDGKSDFANGKISLTDAQDGTKLAAAFEQAGYKSGKLEFTGGKLTITGVTQGEKASALLGGAGKVEIVSTGGSAGTKTGGLTLQIGDTSDGFNQLTVSIEACTTADLGIDDIDISTQDGAKSAVDQIKDAINYVSSVRGTLGATQNRLEHTINNLSVTTENMTAAESRIRDVDVAKEMMAYTKNNILVQSAQAMLAQANQVPQGVLQLLQ